MKLAVYRTRIDGEIHRVHECLRKGKEVPLSELEETAKAFNANGHDTEVEIVDLKEGSLEMFLYTDRISEVASFKDEISNVMDTLSDLESSCEWMKSQIERWSKAGQADN